MGTRILTIGVLSLVLATPLVARADDDRPTGEPGGLFSLFMGGASATPTPATEEPSAEGAPDVAGPAETESEEKPEAAAPPVAEPPPAVAAPSAEESAPAAAEAEAPAAPPAPPPVAAEPEREEPPVAEAPAAEAPSVAAPAESAPAGAAEEPAWPARSDSGGTLAEQPTPAPEATPAAGLAALEPPSEASSETREEKADEPERASEPKRELAAREVPLKGGSVAPGAVALPETEIQGEIEKPDIFFLLPKARDQSDDQVIRARIRREITQPLVKEWLEEMMLLK